MADGISAVDIGMLLFDVEPNPRAGPRRGALGPASSPSRTALVGHAGAGIAATLARLGRWLARALREPRRARRRAADGLAGLWEVTWNLARPAPKVAVQHRRSGRGAASAGRTSTCADFKHVKNALGGTVNDVTLAVAAGALRRWLVERDVAVDGLELKALVPVSIRTENEHGELGNKLTAMRGPLPVGVADPVERLHAVSAAMDALKASKQPLGAEAIWGLNDWFRDFAPPLLLDADRGDQLLDPPLQPAGHQLPRAAGPVLRARPRADRGLPDRLPRPPPRPGDRDPQLQRHRSASVCSPTPTRSPTSERIAAHLAAAVEELARRRRR